MSVYTYAWAGEPHASESIKYVDGVEVARNLLIDSTSEPVVVERPEDSYYRDIRTGVPLELGQTYTMTVHITKLSDDDTPVYWQVGTGSQTGVPYTRDIVARQPIVFDEPNHLTFTVTEGHLEGGRELLAWRIRNEQVATTVAYYDIKVERGDAPTPYFDGDTPTHSDSAFKVWHEPAVTHEWLGEPQASASVKKVDGVEVARNLMPGFGGWEMGDSVEVFSASHLMFHDKTSGYIVTQGFPVQEPGTRLTIAYEARSSTPRPDRETAYALNTFVGFEIRSGRGVSFPPDGEWHWTSSTQTVENYDWWFRFSFNDLVSPDLEVRNVQAYIETDDLPDFFNGDTPSYKLDGEWRLVPTLVCKGGQFQHASIKKYAEGEYRST